VTENPSRVISSEVARRRIPWTTALVWTVWPLAVVLIVLGVRGVAEASENVDFISRAAEISASVAALTLAAPDSGRCEQLGCQLRSGRHETPQAREAGYASYVHSAVLIPLILLLEACSHPTAPSAPSAPATPAAVAKAETGLRAGPPLATPGEHMQYKLSLQGVDLATYDLSIGEVTEVGGKQAVVVQGHAKVSGLVSFLATIDDRFTSWVDVSTGQSLRFQTDEYASGSRW